jgi:hypothetical protein
MVRQHSLSKHSHFWPNFANQSYTGGGRTGLNDFRASNGWLEVFHKHHYIQFRLLSRKSAGMDENVINH